MEDEINVALESEENEDQPHRADYSERVEHRWKDDDGPEERLDPEAVLSVDILKHRWNGNDVNIENE